MKGTPYCTNYKFVDMDRDARRDTGRTHALEGKREVWLRNAAKMVKEKKREVEK